MADDGYECSLDEATLRKAQQELNEDPTNRLTAVQNIREWIHNHPKITCHTDTDFLLRFLRAAKFDEKKAKSKLEHLIIYGLKYPEWFARLDSTDPKITAVIDGFYVVPLPGKTRDGESVILYRMGSFDPNSAEYDKAAIMRTFSVMFSRLIRQEETQVNGFVYLLDAAGFHLKHQLFWRPGDLRLIAKLWQNALPCRFKGFHFLNMGVFFNVLLNMFKPFLSKKFQERMIIHGNGYDGLYRYIPQEILPDEYLPDSYDGPRAGPLKHIVGNFKKEITEKDFHDKLQRETSEFSYKSS